jgi:hypothetical protein
MVYTCTIHQWLACTVHTSDYFSYFQREKVRTVLLLPTSQSDDM